MAKGAEVTFNCQVKIDFGASYYQVYNEENVTKEFMSFVHEHKEASLTQCKEAMTGEDFGYMIKDIPGFMFWLGVNSPYGLHHAKMNPDEAAIEFAVNLISDYLHKA